MFSISMAALAEPRYEHAPRHRAMSSHAVQHHAAAHYSQNRAAAYPHHRRYDPVPQQHRAAPRYSQSSHFARGRQLPQHYRGQQYRVSHWQQNRRLYAPPRGYAWYHADDRYVLAAVATGVISAIILSH